MLGKMKDLENILKPYRARIDDLDRQIVDLLRARYDIIEEVGTLKARENIPATIQSRVDEVRENAATRAKALGLDDVFIGKLYAQLIEHSCALEDTIIDATKHKKAS